MSIESVDRQLARLFAQSEKNLLGLERRVEQQLIQIYKGQLREIQATLAEVYAKFGKDLTFSEMQKYNRLSVLEEQIAEELKRLGVETSITIRKSVGQTFELAYNFAGYQEAILGIKAGIGGLDKDAIRANIVNEFDRIKWPKRHSRNISLLNERVKNTVAEGFIQGYGYEKSARNLRDDIDRSQFETIRILRTEGQRAKSAGRKIANDKIFTKADKLGIELEEVWVATRDSRTRTEHRELHNKPRSKDGTWAFSDGVVTQGPGLSGVARHDIQCRCYTRTKLKGAPDGFEPETVQAIEEWAKSKGISV